MASDQGFSVEAMGIEPTNLLLKAGIDRFAFESEYSKDGFVDAVEGFSADEAFQGFDSEGELAERQ
jgi:hypothetical protein